MITECISEMGPVKQSDISCELRSNMDALYSLDLAHFLRYCSASHAGKCTLIVYKDEQRQSLFYY